MILVRDVILLLITQISGADPYAHYRRPGSACFEKLFDQEEIARFERETAMQRGGIVDPAGDVWGPNNVWEW
jgi:E3 ubiquitin-protein ligase RNF14